MLITSLADTISIGKLGEACLASSKRTTFGWPTSNTRTPNSRAASTLPSTSGRGALSPPIASTAIVIMGTWYRSARYECYKLRRLRPYFFDGFALVVAAVRADPVRLLRLMAVRAIRARRRLQVVVRPPRAAAPL